MNYPNAYLRGTIALNRTRIGLDRAANPDTDQRAWLEQIAELQRLCDSTPNGGQVSADKCPLSGQVSAADTGIQSASLENDAKVSGSVR